MERPARRVCRRCFLLSLLSLCGRRRTEAVVGLSMQWFMGVHMARGVPRKGFAGLGLKPSSFRSRQYTTAAPTSPNLKAAKRPQSTSRIGDRLPPRIPCRSPPDPTCAFRPRAPPAFWSAVPGACRKLELVRALRLSAFQGLRTYRGLGAWANGSGAWGFGSLGVGLGEPERFRSEK